MALEILEIDGVKHVVIHISEDRRRGFSYCKGAKFDIPQFDQRPKTLCNECRLAFAKSKE